MKTYTREYLHAEMHRIREMMGRESFWENMAGADLAVGGLGYVYLNTDNLQESDVDLFIACMEEFSRRDVKMVMRRGL